jgi:chorismate synthase
MSANQWGHRLVMLSFGESHGPALGVVLDGLPAGLDVDWSLLEKQLARRRPGQSQAVSARQEQDQAELLSGVLGNKTLGTPVAVLVRNQDARSEDYAKMKARAGHADAAWMQKFGIHDSRGGGRSSGRETLARVIAGSFAQMLVRRLSPETQVVGYSLALGPQSLSPEEQERADVQATPDSVDTHPLRFPSSRAADLEQTLIAVKAQGESWGGVARIIIRRPPVGLGQPVFAKFKAELAGALSSIGAVSAVEWGAGASAATQLGTQFHTGGPGVYGGIQGGITTGETVQVNVSFKPTSSILDVAKKGRHDPCIVPRAIPVLESMVWFALADQLLWARTDRV